MGSASVDELRSARNGASKLLSARWPGIVFGVVVIDAACFYGLSLFVTDTTHFWWLSANAAGLVFGPMIWKEYCSLRRKDTSLRERQTEKERAAARRKREELQRVAQEAERQHQAELRAEAERQRRRAEQAQQAETQSRASAEQEMPWWTVLDVAPTASKQEIVRNYRRKIQQCHPDRVAGLAPEFVQLAELRTKALNVAYEQAIRTSR